LRGPTDTWSSPVGKDGLNKHKPGLAHGHFQLVSERGGEEEKKELKERPLGSPRVSFRLQLSGRKLPVVGTYIGGGA